MFNNLQLLSANFIYFLYSSSPLGLGAVDSLKAKGQAHFVAKFGYYTLFKISGNGPGDTNYI